MEESIITLSNDPDNFEEPTTSGLSQSSDQPQELVATSTGNDNVADINALLPRPHLKN